MKQNKSQQEERSEELQHLSGGMQRPQRRSGWSLPAVVMIVGGLVVAGMILFFVFHGFSSQTSAPVGQTTSAATPQSQGSVTGKGGNSTLFDTGYPPVYWQIVKTEMASGLHLSVDQFNTKLHQIWNDAAGGSGKNDAAGDPGTAVAEIAIQQGISADQLRTIELNAVQKGLNQMAAQRVVTQNQANTNLETLRDHSDPNGYIASVFMNH